MLFSRQNSTFDPSRHLQQRNDNKQKNFRLLLLHHQERKKNRSQAMSTNFLWTIWSFFTQLCYLYSFILGHFLFTTHFLLGLPASHFCADQLLDRSLAAKWARLLITTDDYATRILLWLCCKISYWAVLVLECSARLQHGWVVAGSILAALRFFTEAWRPVDWFRGG